MARAIFQSVAVDDQGNEQTGVTVRVTNEPGGTQLASLFTTREDNNTKANPFTTEADTGAFDFYAAGGAYRILLTKGTFTRELRYVAIGTAAEKDLSDFANSETTWYGDATGTNAYVVAKNSFTPDTLTNGFQARCRIVTANTAAATLKVGDFDAKPIVLQGDIPLVGGEMRGGYIGAFEFDSNFDAFVIASADAVQTRFLKGSASLTFGEIAAGGASQQTLTVAGAAVGDVVTLGVPAASFNNQIIFQARVSAANTVSITATSNSGGAITPGVGVFKVVVFK